MADEVVHAEVFVEGCEAELWVNDLPVGRARAPGLPFLSVPAHQFLVRGNNELGVVVNPGPSPSLSKTLSTGGRRQAVGMSMRARLVSYEEGEFVGPEAGETEASVEWTGPDDETDFPLLLQTTADLGPRFGNWAWERLGEVALDTATREQLASVLAEAHAAFAARDAERLIELALPAFDDLPRAYPSHSRAGAIAAFRRDLAASDWNRPWEVEPLIPDEFDLRLVAGGRMVECVDRNWRPLLRTTQPPAGQLGRKRYFEFPLVLGRLGETWRKVR